MGDLEDAATLAAAMGPLGKNFIPLLFNLLDQAHGVWTSAGEARAANASAESADAKPTSTGRGIGGSADAMAHLAETIRCYAAVAEQKLLAKLCKQVASKLGKSGAQHVCVCLLASRSRSLFAHRLLLFARFLKISVRSRA
jgi:hypothetical protein